MTTFFFNACPFPPQASIFPNMVRLTRLLRLARLLQKMDRLVEMTDWNELQDLITVWKELLALIEALIHIYFMDIFHIDKIYFM